MAFSSHNTFDESIDDTFDQYFDQHFDQMLENFAIDYEDQEKGSKKNKKKNLYQKKSWRRRFAFMEWLFQRNPNISSQSIPTTLSNEQAIVHAYC